MNYKDTMLRLNSVLNRVGAAYALVGRKYGLNFNALMMVYIIEESEPVTQKQLCDELYLPKSTVHSILLELVKSGYVQLVEGSNRKEKYITATQPGRALFEKICSDTERIEKNVLETLGDSECARLLESAEKLALLLQNETEGYIKNGN